MKLTRNQKYLIKTIAEKLPVESRTIQSGTNISGEDLILSNIDEVNGKPVDPEKEYMMNVPMYFECVHVKRLAKVAKKRGFEGLISYVSRYLDEAKVSKLNDNLLLVWNSKNAIA